jgi:hypothetical protein
VQVLLRQPAEAVHARETDEFHVGAFAGDGDDVERSRGGYSDARTGPGTLLAIADHKCTSLARHADDLQGIGARRMCSAKHRDDHLTREVYWGEFVRAGVFPPDELPPPGGPCDEFVMRRDLAVVAARHGPKWHGGVGAAPERYGNNGDDGVAHL